MPSSLNGSLTTSHCATRPAKWPATLVTWSTSTCRCAAVVRSVLYPRHGSWLCDTRVCRAAACRSRRRGRRSRRRRRIELPLARVRWLPTCPRCPSSPSSTGVVRSVRHWPRRGCPDLGGGADVESGGRSRHLRQGLRAADAASTGSTVPGRDQPGRGGRRHPMRVRAWRGRDGDGSFDARRSQGLSGGTAAPTRARPDVPGRPADLAPGPAHRGAGSGDARSVGGMTAGGAAIGWGSPSGPAVPARATFMLAAAPGRSRAAFDRRYDDHLAYITLTVRRGAATGGRAGRGPHRRFRPGPVLRTGS